MKEYREEFLNYEKFLQIKYGDTKIIDLKFESLYDSDINNYINQSCLNKSFFYIMLWEKWILLEKTVSYYSYNVNTEKYTEHRTRSSFNDFDFVPYEKKEARDILPIIDTRGLFQVLNFGKQNDFLNSIYDKIYSGLDSGKFKERIDEYIDQDALHMQKTMFGLYVDILTILKYDFKNYIADLSIESSNLNYPNFFTDFKFNKMEYCIKEKIKEIKIINFNSITEIEEYNALENINFIFNKIIKLIQTINTYTQRIYEKVNPKAEKININNLIQLSSKTNLSIDRLLEIAKPQIKPIFKKSYVARENNLFGYANIKMIKNIKEKDTDNINYVEIDNFDIPYNNILSFDYNVAEQEATLILIDTEGNLSEMLIIKMYSFFNSNNKYVKDNKTEDIPEYFLIEYGWAGPKSEDQEELIKEKIFVKNKFRGYLNSVTSQFKPNGTEYTLKIKPHNFIKKEINSAPYDIFYGNEEYMNFSYMLIFLYLILKYLRVDEEENKDSIDAIKFFSELSLSTYYINRKGMYTKEAIYIEKIFFRLLLEMSFRFRPIKGPDKKTTVSYIIYSIYIEDTIDEVQPQAKTKSIKKYTEISYEIKKDKHADDFQLLELIFSNAELEPIISGEKIQVYHIYEYKKNLKLEDIKNLLVKPEYSLNAWLVATYLILYMKHYYLLHKKDFFLFHDTTGLFNFFNVEPNDYIDVTLITDVINNFNPFKEELTKKQISTGKTIDIDYYLHYLIKNSMEKQYNKYELIKIVDPMMGKNETEKIEIISKLTFFEKKMQEIFSSIKNLGSINREIEVSQHIISEKINIDFKTNDNMTIEDIKEKYKKIIFSSKNVIPGKAKDREVINSNTFFHNYEKTRIFLAYENDFDKKLPNKDTRGDYFYGNEQRQKFSNQKKVPAKSNILFLSYNFDVNKLIKDENFTVSEKVNFLSKLIVQSYSLTPRITPKTRNSNKQFFAQGNEKLLSENAGDIIDFEIDKMDIQNIVALHIKNKNEKNVGFDGFTAHTFMNGLYENAAKYYRTYTDINGQSDKLAIAKDMAELQANYKNEIQLKAEVTIFGEPYWSDINLLRNKYIYLNIYYLSGMKSSHSGLYMVLNAVHSISNGRYTTKLSVIRQYTFLSNFQIKEEKTTYLM